MKKIWFSFAALLLGSSLTFGYEAAFQHETVPALADQTAVSPGTYYVPPEDSYGLTPKRAQTTPLVQHVPVPMPVAAYHSEQPVLAAAPVTAVALRTDTSAFPSEPAGGTSDAYIYGELERLNDAIAQLQKDTAKPDPKKSFSAPKLSGRILFDSYTINEPGTGGNLQNKAGLRELRLTLTGTGYEVFDYKAELATAKEGKINIVDVWVGAKNIPGFGYLRVGHYNVETGIGYLSGSTNTTSTEYLPPASAFLINRRAGISSEHLFAKDRIRWFYGIFQGDPINDVDKDRALKQDDQGLIFNTRLTAVPYYAGDGRYFLHIGGHYSYLAASTQGVSTQVGGSGWGLGNALSTGAIASNHHHRGGLELAYQSGPFGIISEAFFARYGAADGDRMATGASVELSYFLTREHRNYNLSTGLLGAPKMDRPFQPFKCGDWNLIKSPGAWQVFTQYGYTDLGDWRGISADGQPPAIIGGLQHDLTFGVNWFWTPTLRWVFEYTHSQQNVRQTYAHREQDIFGARVQMSW